MARVAQRLSALDGGAHDAQALGRKRESGARHERACARWEASVGIIDSTFIEAAYGGPGTAPSGYKRATGCSAHFLIDKNSNVLAMCVLPANLQDAEGARILVPAAKEHFPNLKLVLGDKAYRQKPLAAMGEELGVEINGDSPPLPKGTTFVPMPLRWRVERFFSWLAKWRRVAKNWCYSLDGFLLDMKWAVFGLALTLRA